MIVFPLGIKLLKIEFFTIAKWVYTITIENTLIKEERIKTKTGNRKTPTTIVLSCLMLTITKENTFIKEKTH
jgi:hypothetical protein